MGEFDEPIEGVEAKTVAGATILGLAMFATLFLGCVLAVFLTLGAVRGDAERGLLQPVLVRPLRRRTVLVGRFAGAAGVCAAYVVVVFVAAAVITWAFSDWWPDRVVVPAIQLAAAVTVLTALSLAGSVVLSSTANGIAVFMLFGAGLVAGLLGQIGEALGSRTLGDVASVVELGAALRGALPGRAGRDHGRHGRLHAAGHRARAVRRRPGRQRAAVAVGARLRAAGRRGRLGGVLAPRPVTG